MPSVHSLFARFAAPFVAGRRQRAARMLTRFAKAELGSSLTMRWAAARTTSPGRRAEYLLHALDEERHARLFSARARKLGAAARPLVADADDLFRLLGERRFVAFVERAEGRGEREFRAYERSFRSRGDHKTAAVFGVVLRDERRHVEYSKRLFRELGVGAGTSLGVALWEAARGARRGARAVLGALNHALLLALYVMLLPFSLVARLRGRRQRAARAPRAVVPALER